MFLGPRVHIRAPDPALWRRAYPDGLGASAFGSPEFQAAMLEIENARTDGAPWVQRAVSVDGSDLWLPVLGLRDRVGRWRLAVMPIGYDMMPTTRARLTQAEFDAWLVALCTPRVTFFEWWLPAWHTEGLHLQSRRTPVGGVEVGSHETYVIALRGTAEQHLEQHVSSTMRRYVRRNDKAGVTVMTCPDTAQIDAYFAVYERSFHDNAWVGDMFPRRFFDTVARQLGRGGELAVVLHAGQVVGGGVLMYDRDVVHYFQGAIDRGIKDINPHVALYWHALRSAEARGIGHVNLGGVNDGNEGLVRFKTSWGATATPSPMLTFRSGPRYALQGALDGLRARLVGTPLHRMFGGGRP